jgi:hypothetical protein
MKLIPLFAMSAALASSACNTYMCDTGIFPALSVEIRDSTTNAPAAAGATAVATNGVFTDSVLVTHDLLIGLAEERAGRYTIRVRKEGYRLWSRSSVVVESGDCGVNTVHVLARLQPT